MELSNLFKEHLISFHASEATVKNYVADVKRFIRFFEQKYAVSFKPELVTSEMIQAYRSSLVKDIGERSVERHLSSLRKFFQFAKDLSLASINPCSIEHAPPEITIESEAKLKEFKDFLYRNKAADLTIKNYIIDVRQFLSWFMLAESSYSQNISPSELVQRLRPEILTIYKERLVHDSDLSIPSINRKLSSLRTYIRWALAHDVMPNQMVSNISQEDQVDALSNIKEDVHIDPLLSLYEKQHTTRDHEENDTSDATKTYSRIPPIRMTQKIIQSLSVLSDLILITPLAYATSYCQFIFWTKSGARIFEAASTHTQPVTTFIKQRADSISRIKNIKPSFYAPLSSSVATLPIHHKLLFHLFNTRPVWYKKYTSVPLAKTLHMGILISSIGICSLLIYNTTLGNRETDVLGEKYHGQTRSVSFKGALADDNGNPITSPTNMRFSLYSSPTASGEAKLWEEVQEVIPDDTGEFIVALGNHSPIPEDVFVSGNKLYVGVSIGSEAELSPRQPIANVHLAKEAQTLQGLLPITHSRAKTENVILALDSSGNLTLGGQKSHTFQATGGSFSLRGQQVLLSTLRGSNGSITLSPDGQGIIDIQKPIQNTSENIEDGPLSGAVRIDDIVSISATASGQPSLTINQNGVGPLISASSSGITRFTVDNIGSTTIGHNVTVNGTDIGTSRPVFSLLNRNAVIVNFAGESEAVTIGSHSGTTTIRNARTAISGDLTISGTIGTTFFGTDSGITFSGGGNHTITASSGNLRLGTTLRIGENANIIPETTNGTNNLGSQDKPFDTLYVNNIVSPALSSSSSNASFWTQKLGILRPTNITNDILLGGSATSSALVRLGGTNGSHSFFHTGGNFGIGTTNPLYKVHLTENRSDDAVALIENTDVGSDADVLKLKIGSLSPSSTNSFISFLDGNNTSLGSIEASSSGGVSYLTTSSDFAEYFKKENPEENMEAGDVVCLGALGGVTKCNNIHTTIVGVITDRAGFVGASNRAHDSSYVLVGLHGQIPVRVLAHEHIMPGDSLTTSDINGVVRRTNDKGQIIGRALVSSGGQTKVLAYINPTWHDPQVSLRDTGNLSIVPIQSEDEDTSSYLVMDTISNTVLGSIGVFSETVSGTIKAGLINAGEIVVKGGVKVGGTIASKTVEAGHVSAETLEATESLIARTVTAEAVETDRIIAPIVESEQIKVSILSPVSDDSLTVHLRSKRVDFVSSDRPDTPVASIDSQGNATFSGDLTAHQASFSGTVHADNAVIEGEIKADSFASETASISGKLIAKEIIAEKLKLPDETMNQIVDTLTLEMMTRIATLLNQGVSEATIATILDPIIPDEKTSTLVASDPIATPSAGSLAYDDLNQSYVDSASISAIARFIPDLTSDKVTVNHGLMVFGVTSLSDASVANLLSVGGNMTIQNGSINTLSQTLELQPLRQGNISFMAGRIMIDTDGNAIFNKNVTVGGTLFARGLKPLPGDNLTIGLTENETFEITNASNSAITINSIGDIIASGSGTFLDLIAQKVKVVTGAQADTSLTETVASGSAGVGTIVPYETERTIVSPFVTKDSLIYLTPASETYGQTAYIARQTPEDAQKGTKGSFTIRIQNPRSQEIKVNWWIIN